MSNTIANEISVDAKFLSGTPKVLASVFCKIKKGIFIFREERKIIFIKNFCILLITIFTIIIELKIFLIVINRI